MDDQIGTGRSDGRSRHSAAQRACRIGVEFGGRDYEEIIRGVYDGIDTTVARLNPHPGERILDVATGTGITARACARRGADVTAMDIAAGLLDAARELSGGLDIDYRLGDAEALPVADASFDAVVSTFGVMFVSRPEAAAAELARVCKPGGRLALATWTLTGPSARCSVVMRPYMAAPPAVSPFDWGRRERLEDCWARRLRPDDSDGDQPLCRDRRRSGLEHLRHRLRPDPRCWPPAWTTTGAQR